MGGLSVKKKEEMPLKWSAVCEYNCKTQLKHQLTTIRFIREVCESTSKKTCKIANFTGFTALLQHV